LPSLSPASSSEEPGKPLLGVSELIVTALLDERLRA
jgi:hypothetical protein